MNRAVQDKSAVQSMYSEFEIYLFVIFYAVHFINTRQAQARTAAGTLISGKAFIFIFEARTIIVNKPQPYIFLYITWSSLLKL